MAHAGLLSDAPASLTLQHFMQRCPVPSGLDHLSKDGSCCVQVQPRVLIGTSRGNANSPIPPNSTFYAALHAENCPAGDGPASSLLCPGATPVSCVVAHTGCGSWSGCASVDTFTIAAKEIRVGHWLQLHPHGGVGAGLPGSTAAAQGPVSAVSLWHLRN